MSAGRRHPGSIPELSGTGLPGLVAWAKGVVVYLRKLQQGFSGVPAPHADTHRPEHGRDAIATAAPAFPTGTAASEGTADTLLRSDSITKQGIVTTKGHLLGHSATVPAPVPAPVTNGHVLTADLAEATAMKWAAPAAAGAASLTSAQQEHADLEARAAFDSLPLREMIARTYR